VRPEDAAVLTVLIADDSATFRAGIRAELEQRGLAVAGEAGTVDDAVRLASALRPDVCLVDFALPGNGLAAVSRIAKDAPSTCVVVIADSDASADVLASLERGAAGYLLKTVNGEELAASLRAASRGEPALSRSLVPVLVSHVRRGSRRRLVLPTGPVSLTAREWDVGELLRDGYTTDEIATRLGLSPVTVRRHLGLMMAKVGASTRDAAVQTLRAYAR
jgi:DNA-binding NarL/FixJ family response regulator